MIYHLSPHKKESWKIDLEWLSRITAGCLVTIEVASPSWGVQLQESRRSFDGFSYDLGRDVLYILTRPSQRAIPYPEEIIADFKDGVLRSLTARTALGEVETIFLSYPPRLGAPAPSFQDWPVVPPYRSPTDT